MAGRLTSTRRINKMRILQIFNNDSGRGGGAIVMQRVHHGLRKAGADSRILCGRKLLESPYSTEIPRSRIFEGILWRIAGRQGLNNIHGVRSFKIRKMVDYLNADVLHIHGIHGGYFSFLALPSLTRNKPTVYTLHDMWSLTGHCVYSYDCNRWKIGCGKCPYPNSYPAVRKDNTHLEWKLKNWIYSRSSLTIVTLSSWLTEVAKQSILKCFPIYQIPNGVNTETYKPLDSKQCRSMLGISPNKKVLMFMAWKMSASTGEGTRKGSDLLLKALKNLPELLKHEIVLLLAGDGGETIAETADIETRYLGYVSSDHLKAIAYSAADIFIHPTRADNLPLTLIESMACGTPMVSFKVGGVPDLVRPGITGYLAEPENAEDLCRGIVELLEDETLRNYMSQQCRAIALKEYSLELHVQRHIELYRQLILD